MEAANFSFGTAIQAWNKHQYEEAFARFEKYIKEFPESPWVAECKLHLGCACQYNGRLAESAGWFNDILATAQPKSEMYNKAKLRRSILLLDQGNLDESAQGFAG